MRTLLIDNYDSFTYNLYQLISEVNGVEPTVVRNDEARTVAELGLRRYDNVVVSPGPGRPDVARDVGISAAVIRDSDLPLLGVCLGHQGIVVAAGGVVAEAPSARHGYLDRIEHDGRDLFAGVPQGFTAVRYHSLCALRPLPDDLEVTALSGDGVVMGVRHRTRPQWGVQFHPESIASEFGAALLRNFARLTTAHRSGRASPAPSPSIDAGEAFGAEPVAQGRPLTAARTGDSPVPLAAEQFPAGAAELERPAGRAVRAYAPAPRTFRLQRAVLERPIDTESAFVQLYANSPTAFWLDSEHVEPGADRFSFLGDASGPLAEVLRYRVGDGAVTVESSDGHRRTAPGGILEFLAAELRARKLELPDLPFDFAGGYVGYLGYEVKADCGGNMAHRAPTPDAQWIFADRMVVVDHVGGRTHLLALSDDGETARSAADWLRDTRETLDTLPTWTNPPPLELPPDGDAVAPLLTRGRERYLADIAVCLQRLHAGESYEINLTDSATIPAAAADGLDFYRTLRRCNPAPYAAYLRFDDLDIACSSPERFLKIDRRRIVESKPIKGTAPRGATQEQDERLRRELADSPKTRAENLMIVDLLRNDLGRVCEIGSVYVPKLMVTEQYATVHQLVSTVRGKLRPEVGAVDCLRACFPGGSMTGAPKLRTMEIIDELETEARGVYSGTIGFLGLGGTADLNIVIRTAVRYGGRWRIGAGGAIVLDSDPADEYHEVLLKAAATLRAAADPAHR
ncbi:aminodeoxychorismate synthase component I [Nocardia implantans]|uniref:aminodeoxychorismate synthase n=1 Tax=Nocardia implantans TaxID=3108168 RepID=A0ABU6AQG2_9NOCA|nr:MULTISPECIES: aminodeoxychorismate synthase component I [unclassified Nocardia]MBF6190045.1 aminodeoxychorismate synthase component I [Nocardia beijingensis]MEA3526722.1 aminodeoxychorismate synthase component I [Nocardia sp. CDC192]MEB3509701.1 aminodeoxychorismate synthase component I [Nocardia sp. CDC186]